MNAIDKLTKARTGLILDQPFFGALALRLKTEEARWQKTMMVDGVTLFYNPDFVDELNMPELKGVLAHEVMHCALGHPWRRGARDPDRWNEAADYVINGALKKAGFTLPEGGLLDPSFDELAAEQAYDRIGKKPEQPQGGGDDQENGDEGQGQDQDQDGNDGSGSDNSPGEEGDDKDGDDPGGSDNNGDGTSSPDNAGDKQGDEDGQGNQPQGGGDDQSEGDEGSSPGPGTGQGNGQSDGQQETPDGRPVGNDPGGCGGVIDAPVPEGKDQFEASDAAKLEQEWKVAMAQAAQTARVSGTLGGDLERIVEEELEAQADWTALLRQFMTQFSRDDYSWSRPNRRFVGAGIYLPSVYSESVPPMVVAVDTSGSIDEEMLSRFQGELNSILSDVRPESVHVIYCDTKINAVQEFTPDDFPIELEAKGGGGTCFQPVFDWVKDEEIDPACLVYLTDMWNSDEIEEPEYPVLWADYGWEGYRKEQDFGEHIIIE